MITIKHEGDFKKTRKYLKKINEAVKRPNLEKYGAEGVRALVSATPWDTGQTAMSWRFEIVNTDGRVTLNFLNDHVENHINIAIILQYGHATRTGGWVEGIDYINPVLRPLFEKITEDAWKEVTRI